MQIPVKFQSVKWEKEVKMKSKYKLPPKGEIVRLLVSLKREIGEEYRVSDDPDDNIPGIQVTVGASIDGSWSYQTGDNSFTGGAYSHPHWGVGSLYRRSNSRQLADDILSQIEDGMAS